MDSVALLELERVAASLNLNQRLDVDWLAANIDAEGGHYLWPALWNVHPHRTDPQLVRHLRCQLLLRLATDEQVSSLLDMRLADFDPLPSLRSRAVGEQVARLLNSVPSVAQWQQDRPRRP
ncbi:hypothetical protein KGA66_27670 [Actinocrinis puniceicyclus]|uniref:Uncharacterized protein n=1 Tax=Actinocrinis puniceicyclus TaxID=977794 RepID=A0A8J7WU92_9ACTN|nr:hypothetical protein [Actinocrinis puniceicyclus]MBS2966845.1 hypothetical protein [Actinocrinis puniceicyclus]